MSRDSRRPRDRKKDSGMSLFHDPFDPNEEEWSWPLLSDWLKDRRGRRFRSTFGTAAGDASRPIPVLCAWTDIGGFGSALADTNWNLGASKSRELIGLLARVYDIACLPLSFGAGKEQDTTDAAERVLVLNDGIARTLDLRTGEELYGQLRHYLIPLLTLHCVLLKELLPLKLGVRTVLAAGERFEYSDEIVRSRDLDSHRARVRRPPTQVSESVLVYHPRHFQMNTGLSRAFLVESLGSARGVTMNHFFLDESVIAACEESYPGHVKHAEDEDGPGGDFWLSDKSGFDEFSFLSPLRVEYDRCEKISTSRLETIVYRLSGCSLPTWPEPDYVVMPWTTRRTGKLANYGIRQPWWVDGAGNPE